MLELAQRSLERRLDILGVGARPEMHEQFAHIAVAFAHAGVDLAQRALHPLRIAGGKRIAHQVHLDLEKRQRLRDGIVQFAREERALLRDRRFFLQRVEAQVFHRTRQMRGQRFQQRPFRGGQAELVVEEEIHLAHQAIVLRNRNRHDGLESGIAAMVHACRLPGLDRNDSHAARRR